MMSAPIYGLDGLTLGERLRRARRRTGRRSNEVAFTIETNPEQMARWENDHNIPSLRSFAALAETYRIPMETLYWGPLPDVVASRATTEAPQ